MNHMHWEIADWCNYRCSYCWEGRFALRETAQRYAGPDLISGVERFLSGLKEKWIVRLSSGEPSSHPRLNEIAEMILRSGHRLAMETNLSLPIERYERFVSIAGTRLSYLHASMHLEHVSAEDFLGKCLTARAIIERISPQAGLYVTTVATPENLGRLRDVTALFERGGLRVHLQRLFLDGAYAKYSPIDLDSVRGYFEQTTASDDNPFGRPCFAGKKWIILDIKGNAWRCHDGRGHYSARPEGLLGNVMRGNVVLSENAGPCAYRMCLCPGQPVV
jgi:MoaA/NifB/PqqE/SkfB family radical SAM enzyme